MRAYIIRRLLLMIPTLLLVSILVFLLIRFIPGDVVDAMLSPSGFSGGTVETRAELERFLGLDVPAHVQYARWIGGIVLHGTLGKSLLGSAITIEEQILRRLPVTLELGLLAIAIGLIIALPVGIYSAIRRNTVADYAGRSLAVVGLATPNFWLVCWLLSFRRSGGTGPRRFGLIALSDDLLGNLGVFIIPSLILGTYFAAATMRMNPHHDAGGAQARLRTNGLVQGPAERVVVVRHAIKNALIPVITLTGLQLPILIGGSVIMENIFNLPGIGRLLVNALLDRDYPMVSGVNLVFAAGVVVINLVVDLLYAFLDPRVRYR